jgi:hypothetical protein
MEFSGVATSSPVDGAAHKIALQISPGTGTNAITTGNVTPATNGDIIFAAVFDDGGGAGTYSAGTTVAYNGIGTNGSFHYSEYFVQAVAAALSGTFTYNIAFSDVMPAIIAFKPAGGAVPETELKGGFRLKGGTHLK